MSETAAYDPPSGQIHTCSCCGKEGVWGEPWQWHGSWKDWDDGKPIYRACSQSCMDRREEVEGRARIKADIEKAKTEEQRLEEELAKRRRWRAQAEKQISVIDPVSSEGE